MPLPMPQISDMVNNNNSTHIYFENSRTSVDLLIATSSKIQTGLQAFPVVFITSKSLIRDSDTTVGSLGEGPTQKKKAIILPQDK